MAAKHECLRCQGKMVEGFMLDEQRNTRRAVTWLPGPPQHSWLGNVKIEGAQRRVTAYRCAKCGWLDMYARVRAH